MIWVSFDLCRPLLTCYVLLARRGLCASFLIFLFYVQRDLYKSKETEMIRKRSNEGYAPLSCRHCNTLHSTLQHTTQHTATHCNTLQHTTRLIFFEWYRSLLFDLIVCRSLLNEMGLFCLCRPLLTQQVPFCETWVTLLCFAGSVWFLSNDICLFWLIEVSFECYGSLLTYIGLFWTIWVSFDLCRPLLT